MIALIAMENLYTVLNTYSCDPETIAALHFINFTHQAGKTWLGELVLPCIRYFCNGQGTHAFLGDYDNATMDSYLVNTK